MPKRRSTWGSATKMRAGVWRIRYWADTPQGRRRVTETVRGTRRQADDRLAELRVASGPVGGDPTVSEVWERHYAPLMDALVASGQMKPATREVYGIVWRRHVGPRFGSVPASQVMAGDVQDWLLTIGTTTAATAKAVLSNVMVRAVQLGYAATNPACGRFAMSRSEVREAPRGVYDLAQLAALDAAVRGCPIEAAYLLMAHAGLRVGESLAVHAGDLGFPPCGPASVSVRATVGNDGLLAPTKTRKSRTAYVTEPWASRLRELAGGVAPGALLTHDGFGDPLTTGMARNVWLSVEMPPGLGRLPMRNLRNSYETYMRWELGVPIEATSRLLGHSSTAVTEAHYDRPTDDSLVRAVVNGAARMAP